MIIDCISDLHGFLPELQGGDLLIIAGDLTARDLKSQYEIFNDWLRKQNYKKIVIIGGNHDGFLEKNAVEGRFFSVGYYLEDAQTEFEGVKIWGSPWTPTFYDWHFMKDRGKEIREKWELIPKDTDILITHGPPYGILDKVEISSKGDKSKHAGCMDLMDIIPTLPNLKLHVFGHIHESPGVEEIRGTKFVNATIMNQSYKPVNKPIRIIL